jgi:hypothetical protein
MWWQTTAGRTSGVPRRVEWMRGLVESWGSTGLVLVEGDETLAAVQFAPVRSLPRGGILPAGPPPSDAVLLFCLRGRLGRSSYEPSRLLHRSMGLLRERRVDEVYAFARPLGSASLCGLRNLCGLEFLQANGFVVVRGGGDAFLMKADLRGLLPSLKDVSGFLRRFKHHPAPTPAPPW